MLPTGTDDLRWRRAQRIRGLYAITPDTSDTPLLVAKLEAALQGGANVIQYRNKSASAELRRAQAMALARLTAARGGLSIVNDDVELALEVGADGVHLGEDDASIDAARKLVGAQRIIGISCYNDFARAQRAVAAGADYVAFGSFYPSSVKPDARQADASLLVQAGSLGVPVVAIGGITADNARALARAGAHAVAVISAVFAASDVESAARAIAAAYD
jgi:thiamine-phosphate pyrophosphorylase